LFAADPSLGQEQSQEELAKQAQNPIANLVSVPFQNNTNFGIGPDDETQNVVFFNKKAKNCTILMSAFGEM